jgi:hypothetical protein
VVNDRFHGALSHHTILNVYCSACCATAPFKSNQLASRVPSNIQGEGAT